jgi:tRNA modification GTPase
MSAPAYEVLTARGRGGIAVVRLAGAGAMGIAAGLSGRGPGPPGSVVLASLRSDGELIDRGLLVQPAGEGGAAGEEVEFHLHGGPAVVDRFVAALEAHGARRRPDGRDPWLDAELVGLLLAARGPEAAGLALEQRAEALLPLLVRARAGSARGECPAAEDLSGALARSRAGRAHFEPLTIALWGRKNAGKSSLLNRLLGDERALAGPLPGLTRDPVGADALLAGYPVALVDLPGLGPGGDELDHHALRLAEATRARADLAVLVVDRAAGIGALEQAVVRAGTAPAAWVLNKVDLPSGAGARFPAGEPLACLRSDREDLAPLVRSVFARALRRLRDLPPAGPMGAPAALSAAQEAALARLAAAAARRDAPSCAALLDDLLLPPPAEAT